MHFPQAESTHAFQIARPENKRIDSAIGVEKNVGKCLKMTFVIKCSSAPGFPHPEDISWQHTQHEHDDSKAEHFDYPCVSMQAFPSGVALYRRQMLKFRAAVELQVALVEPVAYPSVTVSNDGQRYTVINDEKCQGVVVRVPRPRPCFYALHSVVIQSVDIRTHNSDTEDPDYAYSFDNVSFFKLWF